ncbi:Putative Holin-X, holin superfamily III [Sphingomonas palmae]|uniref:Putative Holin-X, holin superfamily III n=1 Tax=Sphingomonas palmae TaxID=1855283 RepID=A0A1H7HAG8_9SPHN|nr:phage holin family protein [Sphingomonas palmae]SEK46030.1 Putative Holin-X, holin superfamily III [Sphingomonas palmae]
MSDPSNVTPIRRAAEAVRDRVTPEPGLTDLVSRLTGDAKDLARAEFDLQKAKVGEAVGRYKNAIIFFAVAAVLALAGLIALLVGAIETLATLIGPGLATLIVVGGTLLIAAILGIIGKHRLSPKADA